MAKGFLLWSNGNDLKERQSVCKPLVTHLPDPYDIIQKLPQNKLQNTVWSNLPPVAPGAVGTDGVRVWCGLFRLFASVGLGMNSDYSLFLSVSCFIFFFYSYWVLPIFLRLFFRLVGAICLDRLEIKVTYSHRK